MKILVFAEGTATQHPTEEQFSAVPSFVPTDGTVEKLTKWREQGAQICYLTSRRSSEDLQAVRATLRRFGFPSGDLFSCREDEDYVALVARVGPDILIEDDCKSIGWEEVTTPKLKAEWGIRGIIVPEFGGLAHLPDDHGELVRMGSRGAQGSGLASKEGLMSDDENREGFLQEANVAVLATVDSKGRAHAAPIWYLYEGGVFIMSSGRSSQKHRNVEANPDVTLVMDRRTLPYYAVMARGPAEIGPPLSDEERRRMAVRYLGEEMAQAYLERTAGGDSVTIRLRPRKLIEYHGRAGRTESG